MKKTIDINCDLGEGMDNDAFLMPYISSANIACGYHAGNEELVRKTVDLCLQYDIAIGAHFSFDDKQNFGRTEMKIPAYRLFKIILDQLNLINTIAKESGGRMTHVKAHGALYNMASCDPGIAETIAHAVKIFNPKLVVFGLSGSHMISETIKSGLNVAAEAFADRNYNDDAQLVSRSEPGALIQNVNELKDHVLRMIRDEQVITVTGNKLPIQIDTLCLHGDGPHAVEFARALNEIVLGQGISIMNFAKSVDN